MIFNYPVFTGARYSKYCLWEILIYVGSLISNENFLAGVTGFFSYRD
jgi:hypothetical protein